MAKFKDDNFEIISEDIFKIRKRPSVYVSMRGEKGVLHLCKEGINNCIDECLKPDSCGDTVVIEITKDYVRMRDNGRGIPCKLLRVVHETNQAGSNFTRETGAKTAGENGSGTTCMCALSHSFQVTSYRPGEGKKLTLKYVEGELKSEVEERIGKDGEHGLETVFSPSKQIMGYGEIPCEELITWLSGFRYTLPERIKLSYKYNGETVELKRVPLHSFLTDRLRDNRLCEPVNVEFDGHVMELYEGEELRKEFSVRCSLMYSSKDWKDELIRHSWMNMIYNKENGSHMDGVIDGLVKCMTEQCVRRKSSLKNENLRKDVLANLNVVVCCECNMIDMFTSQAKDKVWPDRLQKAIAKAMYEALGKLNSGCVSDLVDVVIANNRVRKEGERVRDIKSETKKVKWEKPDSFIPCSTAKTDEPKELFLVEGKSAGGGLREARYPRFQAILQFRGKSLNVWHADIAAVLKSEPWLNLVKIMGCGIGDTFDIRKLQFDRIIIATDADIDGYHIRVQMCAFYLKFYPEIIQRGMLYIAEPPLYQIARGKDVSYVASQGEYIEKCIASIGKVQANFPMSKTHRDTSAADFITDAFDYLTRLTECAINRSVNRYLLENVAYAFVKYGTSRDAFELHVDDWIKSVLKIFPEIGYDHNKHQLFATINLKDELLVIDDELVDALEYVIKVQTKYGLLIHIESDIKSGSYTLGQFFETVESMYPLIKDRYKGLGSSPGIVSREVIMDPKTRRIFRVTMQDIDVMKRMSNLVGDRNEDINNRKEMLYNFKMTSDMLDN